MRGDEGHGLSFIDQALAVGGIREPVLVDDLASSEGVVGGGEAVEYNAKTATGEWYLLYSSVLLAMDIFLVCVSVSPEITPMKDLSPISIKLMDLLFLMGSYRESE